MLKRDHQVVLPTQARAPGFRVELRGTTFRLVATGAWTVAEATQLDTALKRLRVPIPPTPDFTGEMDIAGIAEIDTAGALLLQRTAAAWEKSGLRTRYAGATESFRILIEEVQSRQPRRARPKIEKRGALHAIHRGHDQGGDRRLERWRPAHRLSRRGHRGVRAHDPPALALPHDLLRPSSRPRRLQGGADHRPDLAS